MNLLLLRAAVVTTAIFLGSLRSADASVPKLFLIGGSTMGTFPPTRPVSYPNGAKDDTHYNADGATRVAELAVREIIRLGLPLREWLRKDAVGGKR